MEEHELQEKIMFFFSGRSNKTCPFWSSFTQLWAASFAHTKRPVGPPA